MPNPFAVEYSFLRKPDKCHNENCITKDKNINNVVKKENTVPNKLQVVLFELNQNSTNNSVTKLNLVIKTTAALIYHRVRGL